MPIDKELWKEDAIWKVRRDANGKPLTSSAATDVLLPSMHSKGFNPIKYLLALGPFLVIYWFCHYLRKSDKIRREARKARVGNMRHQNSEGGKLAALTTPLKNLGTLSNKLSPLGKKMPAMMRKTLEKK